MAKFNGPKIVTDGLVLCLDAGNSKSYPGSGTVWTDLSGRNNNGTLTNGPTFDASNAGSIVFDGVNDYVSLASLDLSGTQMSVCCSIKPITLGSGSNVNVILRKGEGNPNNYQFMLGDSKICFILNQDDFNGRISSTTLQTGKWYHAAVSYNAGSVAVYLNGDVDGTSSIASTIGNDSRNTYIGSRNGGDFTSNQISNIVVYNRALSAEEIRQNFNATRYRFGI